MEQCKCHGLDRRTFLRFAVGGGAGLALAPHLPVWSQETMAKAQTKSVIMLWMGGGPSQLDTFDPKPGERTGGEFGSIQTSARGMMISDTLPTIAKQGQHFSIVRTVTTMETAHERGAYLMHTGYSPIAGQEFAPVGTVMSYELAPKDFPLPTFIALSPPNIPQSPHFGDAHLPFAVRNIDNPIPNLGTLVGADREKRRARLLEGQDNRFNEPREGREIDRRRESAQKAQDLMTTPLLKAFDIRREADSLRKQYGGDFGQKCLLARRLVEAGVPFIEVGLGGWDTHDNNFDKVRKLNEQLDTGMGTLLWDLARKDLLKNTLVVWAGEFGRTPAINDGNGRDHWSRCFSVALAGGGVQGGRVIGSTGKQGMDIQDHPVPVQNLFASIYQAMGVDFEKKYIVNRRKVKYAYNGKPVKGLF